MTLDQILKELKNYSEERDWDKFHSPKNLAMALSVEASELVEIFQWLTEEESFLKDKSQKNRTPPTSLLMFLSIRL